MVYFRSAMLAPIFSSVVLLGLRLSPWIPSPAAWVDANSSKRDLAGWEESLFLVPCDVPWASLSRVWGFASLIIAPASKSKILMVAPSSTQSCQVAPWAVVGSFTDRPCDSWPDSEVIVRSKRFGTFPLVPCRRACATIAPTRMNEKHLSTVVVRRRWNDSECAKVPLEALRELAVRNDPGGVCGPIPRPFIYARVWCDQLTDGQGLHACDPATAPHELQLCVLESDNPVLKTQVRAMLRR
jgi:hypothetical protein